MAQEPLRELADNLLSIFKEAAASEYEEQNQRIDSLEMKVDKICTFILESQKLFNSIFAVEENKEDYQIIQTEKPSVLKFDYPKARMNPSPLPAYWLRIQHLIFCAKVPLPARLTQLARLGIRRLRLQGVDILAEILLCYRRFESRF